MGYTKDTVKGVSWVGSLRLSTRIVSFLRTLILARILLPVQFGAFGVAAIVVAFLEVLTETGVNVILVQQRGSIEKHISSAWIVSIVRGFFVGIIIFMSASPISIFFNSNDSLILLQLISIVPVIRGFINPSVVKFQKDLQFNKEFWYRLSIFSVDAATAIILAFLTRNASSFVYGLIAGVLFEVVLSFIVVKPRPSFTFKKMFLRKIIYRGKWVTASGIFNYLFNNLGGITVGRILETTQLGIYQLGYSISILPLTEISDGFSKVTFPIYAKISDDKARLRRAFFRTIIMISLLAIPFGLILVLFSEQIVKILLGDKWLGLIPLLKILGIFGVIRAITGFPATLFLAAGKQEYVSIVTFVSFLGLAFSIIPLVSIYGIVGAGISSLIASLIPLPFIFYFTKKIIS
ncbi:MAG: lipopolysaccharide biosynthesis protein [Candidatus Levybacteria bacterium]|nr:lipopolysaccharide biosynthesis protein [Candidatus Levybacteria bacterium]